MGVIGEGMKDGRRKLSDQQVADLRAARDRGKTYTQLERLFGIDRQAIWRILNGLSYKTSTIKRQRLP